MATPTARICSSSSVQRGANPKALLACRDGAPPTWEVSIEGRCGHENAPDQIIELKKRGHYQTGQSGTAARHPMKPSAARRAHRPHSTPSQRLKPPSRSGELHPEPLTGRVEDWRAGLGRRVSTAPRFQPPPRRTQRADFPHCAPPFASRRGLLDLSCRGDFRPVASHSIAVEQL